MNFLSLDGSKVLLLNMLISAGLLKHLWIFCVEPDAVEKSMDLIVDCAMDFIALQIKAGAHCIGIGDAFCSQIGPDLYSQFAFERQKKLVDLFILKERLLSFISAEIPSQFLKI